MYQLWYSLVGILIHSWGSYLWSPSRCRSKVKGQFWYIFQYYRYISNWWQCVVVRYSRLMWLLMWSGAVPWWGGGGESIGARWHPPNDFPPFSFHLFYFCYFFLFSFFTFFFLYIFIFLQYFFMSNFLLVILRAQSCTLMMIILLDPLW